MGKYIPGLPIAKCILAFIGLLLCASHATAQYRIEVLDSNTFRPGEGVVLSKTSFRGLSVVDDKTIWVSGSRGTIAQSTDGGKIFRFTQLKGYERSDFRDIEAFDDKRAIIMSSGTPAYILKTMDGGQTWKEIYKNTDTAYFLDAMDFWDDKRGVLVGDPINGRFVILQTKDGGDTWQQLDSAHCPAAEPGEAVFAASGTSLRCYGTDSYSFVTGGAASRILTNFFGKATAPDHWSVMETNLIHGKSSTGAFSFFIHDVQFYIVGGDYLNDSSNLKACSTVTLYDEGGMFNNNVSGYRSCIEHLGAYQFITCGTNGCDVMMKSTNWRKLSGEPFHVVRKAKKGKAVFLAGPKGKIGKLIY